MLWILISAALAGTCPWSSTPVVVDASWKTVTVDGVPYSTDAFAAVLVDCGEREAVAKPESWQQMRKVTLGLGAAGCCLVFPWLGAPVQQNKIGAVVGRVSEASLKGFPLVITRQ